MDKFQIRINPELLAAVDAQAKADGMTRTELIIRAVRTRLGNAPSLDGSSRLPNAPGERDSQPSKAQKLAGKVPNVTTAAQLPPPATYQRPSHAANCQCGVCKLHSRW